MAVLPKLGLRLFGVRDVPGPLVFVTRLFGIRDLVLGAGAVAALMTEHDSAGGWVAAGAVADTCDMAAAVVWREELDSMAPVAGGIAAVAGLGGWLSLPGVRRSTRRF
jgi:hypothetical protein